MIKITNIETEKDEIHVSVELEAYNKHSFKQVVICLEPDVVKILEEKKVKVGKCTQSVRLSNTREKNRTGVYIFKKPAPVRKAPKKPTPKPVVEEVAKPKRTVKKASKKSNKKLDNE